MLVPAVPAGMDPRQLAHEIEIARDRVFSGGPLRNPHRIRQVIRDDWQRMVRDRVRPDGTTATFVDDRQLADLRERPDLTVVWNVLRARVLKIADPDFMVVMTDERGFVVRRGGNGPRRRCAPVTPRSFAPPWTSPTRTGRG
ncbi:MAG TPA: hypothetical protein VGD84_09710 [Pseudonocardiaceae bacterium]